MFFRWWRVAPVLLVLALLTACTGDPAVSDFDEAFRADPAVETLDLTSHDNQPFTGGVSGDVHAVSGLDDAGFVALVGRVSAYVAERDDVMQGGITILGEAISLVVSGSPAADEANVRLLLELRDLQGVEAVDLTQPDDLQVAARVDGPDAALDFVRALPAAAADAGVDGPAFDVRTADHLTYLIGAAGDTLEYASTVWASVAESVALEGIGTDGAAIVLMLANEADISAAQAAAAQVEQRAPSGASQQVRFASDVVRLGDADGMLARAVLAQLAAETRAQIRWIWESDGALQVMAASAADVPGLIEEVGADAAGLDARSVQVRAETPRRIAVDLSLSDDLDVPSRAVATLIDDTAFIELVVTARAVMVSIGDMPDAELAVFAAPLKLLSETGARVCIHRPDDVVCISAVANVSASGTSDAGADFVEAWNTAPSAP